MASAAAAAAAPCNSISSILSAPSRHSAASLPASSRTTLHFSRPCSCSSSSSSSIRISTTLRPLASIHVDVPKQNLPDLSASDGPLSSSSVVHFVKYHGIGNDFILVDNRDSTEPKVTAEQAVKLCDRNFGIGANGVIFVMPGANGTDYTMRIFNSDGSEPEMCGNGIRCFARFVAQLENIREPRSFKVQTGAGLIVPEIQSDGQVRVDMGLPVLKAFDIPTKLPGNKDGAVVGSEIVVDGMSWNVTCVSMGNPHCVTFSSSQHEVLEVDELDLAKIGPKFEHHALFPARTNTEFVQVFSPSHLKMRVWERGAGATLACGTGACAVVIAAVLEGRSERQCTVYLPGGPLEIEWNEEDNHVYMTGSAEAVFSGIIHL